MHQNFELADMHLKYEATLREPLVNGHKTYAQVTEDIISPIERKPGRMWYVGFFFSLALLGFGAFSVKHRPARAGRNPRTGEHVPVEQKSVPFFKTGKEMRERLNRNGHDEEAATS